MVDAGALLLDVRGQEEWAAGHAVGALHCPLDLLDPGQLGSGRPIVAICRSGKRSLTASLVLSEAGHEVVSVAGGMKAWQAAGMPVVTDAGHAGTVR